MVGEEARCFATHCIWGVGGSSKRGNGFEDDIEGISDVVMEHLFVVLAAEEVVSMWVEWVMAMSAGGSQKVWGH